MGYIVIQIISDQSPLCLFLQTERPWANPGSSEEDFPCQTRRDSPNVATIWSGFPSLPSPCAELGWASCPACCLQPGYEEHTDIYPDMRGPQPEQDRAYFSLSMNSNFFCIFVTETSLMLAVTPTPPELGQIPSRYLTGALLDSWYSPHSVRPGFLTSSTPGFPEQCLRHPNP